MKNKLNPKEAFYLLIFYFVIAVTILVGWGLNLYQLIKMEYDVITVQIVLKLIGVIAAPLGAIMGYIGAF